MSAIIAACGENFALILADSRMIEFQAGTRMEYIIADENVKKLYRVNNNVCIGICGDYNAGKEAIRELDSYQKEYLTLEKIVKIVLDKAKELAHELLGITIIIVGKNRKGKLTLHEVSAKTNYKMEIYEPVGGVVVRASFPVSEEVSNEIINKHLSSVVPWSTDTFFIRMRDCIYDIADLNDTVNKNISVELIS